MTNVELQALMDKPTEKTVEWLRQYRDASRRAHDRILIEALINMTWDRITPRERRAVPATTIQAEYTPLEEAEWAFGKGGMAASLLAFLSHPEADGAVARAPEATDGLPKWERVRAILEELKKMTDRDWPLSLRG